MVPEAGLEPAQSKLRGILSPLRLPNSATPARSFTACIYIQILTLRDFNVRNSYFIHVRSLRLRGIGKSLASTKFRHSGLLILKAFADFRQYYYTRPNQNCSTSPKLLRLISNFPDNDGHIQSHKLEIINNTLPPLV